MRGLNNDVYFQVALLTTIGLSSSKNAILIVEFAEAKVAEGYSLTRRPAVADASASDHHDLAGVYRRRDATGDCHRRRGQQPRGDRYRYYRRDAGPRRCWPSSLFLYSLYW